MNIFESLVVLNVELNHTVELMVWLIAKSLTIFLPSVVKSQRRCHAMTKNSVIVREMNMGLFQWGK